LSVPTGKILFDLGLLARAPTLPVVVSVSPGTQEAVAEAIRRIGGRVTGVSRTTGVVTAVVPSGQIETITGIDQVISVSIDPTFKIFQEEGVDEIPTLDGLLPISLETNIFPSNVVDFVKARDAIRSGMNGSGIRIGVCDTGIFPRRDIRNVVARRNFIPGEKIARNGHGTAVADMISTVAPGAEIVDIHVLDQLGVANFGVIIEGIEAAVLDEGCNILNLSFGSPIPFPPFQLVVERLRQLGVIFIAAAGNFGPTPATIASPSDLFNVVSVGSVATRNPAPNFPSTFSSRGPAFTGIKPDIVAPGGSLVEAIRLKWLETTASVRGTSFAAPVVAAATAILMQAFPDKSPQFYEGKLFAGATELDLVGKDLTTGFGLLDVERSLLVEPREDRPTLVDFINGIRNILVAPFQPS